MTSISIHFGAAFGSLRGFERRGNASSQADVIFLDQDGFAQVVAMIVAATHADRIFFERAKARRGLASIQNLALRCPQPPAQTVG